jgi:CRP-like cAMP-binding protein
MFDRDILLTKEFKAGETIIREGETGEHLYLIISGSVQILKNHRNTPQQVATLTNGEILGEIGVLSNEPRSATAIALEDTKVVMVKDETILSALTDNNFPLIRPLTQQLVNRFKEYEQQHLANLQLIERLESEMDTMRERLLSFELAADNPN